jgi:Tol biopolymer transport system component
MSLAPGSRLGPYEITAKLGEGGMGEVWRATDVRLKREVAVKVLPADFTADRERLARFEREAQLLAQLHHPNIASVFGLEDGDRTESGARALVMELVDGEDLSQRIARGKVPLEDAVGIAHQIAEALEAAQERGIVHRDLKPANVKIAADGTVKVLDFGLAKAMDAGDKPGSAADLARSPTLMNSPTLTAAHGTQLGVILGTAAYMAPEQARGGAVDKRADIWAFGVVLYEMLTGASLFGGDTVSDTLAGVLKTEIDLARLPPGTPRAVRELLRRCLERRPKNRLHDIADARIVLDEVAAGLDGGDDAVPSAAPRPAAVWRRALPWLVALAAVALGVVGLVRGTSRAAGTRVVAGRTTRFVVPTPGPGEIDGYPAVSPDGRWLAFCFAPDRGVTRLWLHSFERGESRELAGTDHALQPFWSPDGRHLGFFADGELRKVEVATGHVEKLASAPDARGATWSPSGDVFYSQTCCTALTRVSGGGGEPVPLTTFDRELGDGSHRFPWALPGGDALLFTIPDGRHPGIYWLSLKTQKRVFLTSDVARPVYDPSGYLLWNRGGSLAARRFDPGTGTLSGDAVVLAEHLTGDADKAAQDPFSAAGGVIAIHALIEHQRELRWFDRNGTPGAAVTSPGNLYDPVLGRDGRVSVSKSPVPNYFASDVWIYDPSAMDHDTRLSFSGGGTPVWSDDAKTVYYVVRTGGRYRIVSKRADGSGAEELVFDSAHGTWVDDVSQRDRLLVFEEVTDAGMYRLSLLPLDGAGRPRPFLPDATGAQTHATFSPDGRFLSYTSNESGQPQVYVQPVDGSPGRWQVTSGGGDLATWRADGKELFYVGLDRVLRAVPITSLSPFTAGAAQVLFPIGMPQIGITSQHAYYAPSPDGQRFLVNRVAGTASDPGIVVTLDWSIPEAPR